MMAEYIGRNGEIVGLFSPSHGRTCDCHAVCRWQVVVGSVVRFKRDVMLMDRVDVLGAPHVEGGVAETVMKAVFVAISVYEQSTYVRESA